ncbi:MAG: hypothetical protein FWG88_08530 [Oscillospiraceae bacterium]|nr:hypothetical protein [Oscillospiraceae bacterium]
MEIQSAKKLLAIMLIVITIITPILTLAAPLPARALDEYVTVTIPNFPIQINGAALDSRNDRYPLLIYNDIIYFPMTYEHCAYLGIATNWTATDGLYVAATRSSSGIIPDYGTISNVAATYTARIASFSIHINGKLVDNSKEAYPILLFRDITYFPMTYRFATEELSWDISWDSTNGLNVKISNHNQFYFVSISDTYADFSGQVAVYTETMQDDGSIYVHHIQTNRYFGRLNFADDTVTPREPYDTQAETSDIGNSVDVSLQGNSLYYADYLLADLTDLIALDNESEYGSTMGNPIIFYARKFDFENNFYLNVMVYYQTGIPAPYTPFQALSFVVIDNSEVISLDMDTSDSFFSGAYPVSDGIYISTNRSLRYAANKYTLWFISSNGDLHNVNDKFYNFDNVKIIGTVGDTAYLKCLWQETDSYGESVLNVSLINDGYYSMERDYSLTKIHPYVSVYEEILTPTGTIYVFPSWRIGLINLTNGTFIDLSDLPIADIQYLNQ